MDWVAVRSRRRGVNDGALIMPLWEAGGAITEERQHSIPPREDLHTNGGMAQVLRALIRGLDYLLRRAYGVFEFTNEPDCIFRLRLMQCLHRIELPEQTIQPGMPVIELHFWNERIPPIPITGPDLVWAVNMTRLVVGSFRSIACYIQQHKELCDVRAVSGTTVLVFSSQHSGGEKLFRRLGFEYFSPHRGPLGRFGVSWENVYSWALMWAFNAASLQQRRLLSLHRTEIWMSRQAFLDRYGK